LKRIVVLIIGAAIVGKIFAAELMRLAENSSTTSKNLGQSLYLDKDEQLKLNHIRSNLDMVKRLPPRIFTVHKPIAPRPARPLVSKITKTAEKSKEDVKKDEERRKKRQKGLEEKQAEAAQVKAASPPQTPFIHTLPAADYNNSYTTQVAGVFPVTPVIPPNPTSTVPPLSIMPAHVSTLSNNAAVSGWIKLLTTDPTAAEMTNFESQYTKNVITQAEYYQVITAMQASTNIESRNYAVQGANKYQNISSFKILADESTNETDPTVKNMATGDLIVYDNVADVALLNSAAASNDAAEKAEAKAILQLIAANGSGTTVGASLAASRY
jgi:hypothetical protein